MRLSVVAACLSLCLIGFATANEAHASIRKDTNIPAEGLGPALNALARDRNFQIVYVTEEIANLRTAGATGLFTTDEALKRLLTGTGLSYRYLDDKTVTILPVGSVSTQNERAASTASDNQGGDVTDAKEGKKSSSGEFRVAQATTGSNQGSVAVGTPAASPSDSQQAVGLTEIIVTAQKREQRLQDVPIPVTAINTEALLEQNQVRVEDYFNTVPGLALRTDGHGYENLSIRGVTTGAYTNPTVGIVVDDAPFGSTNTLGSRTSTPDLDPSDLARIEVLRGPQGTLYGASSIGGLLKFVTVDPSTDEFSGRVQADINSVYNGAEPGYGVRGAVNIPISDTLAVRASGFSRQDPGYIDNPLLFLHGVNETQVYGGRLSALWKPSESFSLKLSGLMQNTTADGPSDVTLEPGIGPLQQIQSLPGGFHHEIRSFTANMSATLGAIKFVSISGYGIDKYESPIDFSLYYGGLGFPPNSQTLFGTPLAEEDGHDRTAKFTQEFRFSGSFSRIDWLLGAYYSHESNDSHDDFYAINPTTRTFAGLLLDDPYPTTYTEYAGFGDLTFHITDQFDVQIGGREGQSRQSYVEPMTGPLVGGSEYNPPEHSKDNAFTYLVTPEYKFSSNLMAYARLASGYRPGGPNPTCTLFHVPCEYGHDETRNYEVGVKGDALDSRLTFDASIYYINWTSIQLQVIDPTSEDSYYTNGGRAKSQGIELSSQARPLDGLTVGAWITISDAKLTSNLPADASIVGSSGDRLPYSSRFSGNMSAQQDFQIRGALKGFVGGSISYVGNREDNFPYVGGGSRLTLPGYAETNLRLGVRDELWTASLFANNVADKRGVLSYPPSFATIYPIVNYIQPRTVGLSVSRSF